MHFKFHRYLFNPLFWILQWALKQDKIRYIFIYGGSSASKTYTITQALSIEAAEWKASTMVLRKFGVDIEDSVYADFKEVGGIMKMGFIQKFIKRLIRYANGAIIRFRGLDESEKLKGLKGFKYLYYNEFSLFDQADFNQGKKRLRGMRGQKIIADWNPIIQTHWIKTEILDKEEWEDFEIPDLNAPTKYCKLDAETSFVRINKTGNMLLIRVTYKDNFWVVGHPSGKPDVGFYDEHVVADFEWDKKHKPNDYRIYGLGEWGLVRTGSEFWKSFDESVHVKVLAPYREGTIHVSLDNNVQPYVTVSVWQIDEKKKVIRQLHEIPCRAPDNTAAKAALKLSKWLTSIGYKDAVFIYGDPSANAKSTVDDNGKSFFEKFIDTLGNKEKWRIHNRVQKSAPQVSLSGDFINDIYDGLIDGWKIEINVTCRTSIDDYCMTKEDMTGKVLKERKPDKELGISYERYGHFSDAKRYFITTVLAALFAQYRARKKRVGSYAA